MCKFGILEKNFLLMCCLYLCFYTLSPQLYLKQCLVNGNYDDLEVFRVRTCAGMVGAVNV